VAIVPARGFGYLCIKLKIMEDIFFYKFLVYL